MQTQTGLEKAFEIFDRSPTKMAAAIGGKTVRQHVEHWLKSGRIPADKAPAIERATGGQVTRQDLRPDDWHEIWPELASPPAQPAQVATNSIAIGVSHG